MKRILEKKWHNKDKKKRICENEKTKHKKKIPLKYKWKLVFFVVFCNCGVFIRK